MKTLYLECQMGAAGDMLMAALYELLPDQAGFLETMNHLVKGVGVAAEKKETCGITGTHMEVKIGGEAEESVDLPCGYVHDQFHLEEHVHEDTHHHDHEDMPHHDHDHHHDDHHDHEHEGHHHEHHHASPPDVQKILDRLPVPEEVRRNAKAVYDRIAAAESKAHGVPVTEVHFHEVGALDAIVDVTGVCLAMHLLHADQIVVSPVHLGSGQVRCAHGVMPVPTPATAHLLEGLPCYCGEIVGELCTPTGAALLAHFGGGFGPMPVMTLEKTGYGVGKKQFPVANCIRAFLGESGDPEQAEIIELCCHIDDMTAEALAFASERLMEQGALDISTAPLTMKKGRAGVAFTVLCKAAQEERLAQAILRETNTNGVRSRRCRKFILTPSIKTSDTSYGPVRVKCADGFGIHREKPEYADVAQAAKSVGLPFQQVWEDILRQI
ncbi:nickel pincer cofactor biosynthesis protein LarC [Oscillibacter ruminantium]|uniref:nickel pincer cofactor biosynthesis protein LarC n=1 Tax=Oscillibacter ruminantium TaxID=1263547 RepID=UPI000308583B|nr:nickel pincer cofactor biosynthesis protein LarC [Oscillibacter ruminantium]MDD3228892.1 nickel pincer cofactor biosynthesis protein LarC [Oscillospiraceae bacterium]